ncbi:Vitamin B12 import ATP-binding protein BtuD [Propionicimonas sp. T2.31MG-18]|uniref:dipeptide/oligopeptide/nickel ABC transporter permease/ATP-binding protein n=1 Tax=Propionicimonas sp. T2.31MG-18 TaxID=3157620 RepID=UPI0035F0A5B9
MTDSITVVAQPQAVRALRSVRKRPSMFTIVASAWLAIVVIACTFANLLAPIDPQVQDLANVLQGPTAAHWLGTDSLGRDILSRLMFGGRSTVLAVAISIAVYVIVGVVLGLLAGYLGGWPDRIISASSSAVLAMPKMIILFVVLSVYRGNVILAMFVYGLLAGPVLGLIVRAAAMATRNELFVDAARVSGLSPLHIIRHHIFPRTTGLIIVQAAVFGATAIVVESALSFLGFGTQQPDPSWGNMVAEAAGNISLNAWMLYPTGGTIALTALSLGLIGDTLRDRVAGQWTAPKLTMRSVHRRADRNTQVPAATGATLAVAGLGIGYKNPHGVVPVVKDVNFTVAKGETIGIVGESGSGKTTVAFGVLGVIGEVAEISSGSVLFGGKNLVELSLHEMDHLRGRRLAYVAQEPMVALDPNYRIISQLGEAIRRNTGKSRKDAKTRAVELLRLVEIRDPEAVAERYPHQLSGGMAQRVSIALALAGEPELLVADEPTTALDVTVQAGILALLMSLRDKTGMSVVLITHDWGVVADLCDRVAVMYKGEIVEQNTAEGIYRHPQHPYTQALLRSNPHDAKPGQRLPVITGDFETPSMAAAREASSSENKSAAEGTR